MNGASTSTTGYGDASLPSVYLFLPFSPKVGGSGGTGELLTVRRKEGDRSGKAADGAEFRCRSESWREVDERRRVRVDSHLKLENEARTSNCRCSLSFGIMPFEFETISGRTQAVRMDAHGEKSDIR